MKLSSLLINRKDLRDIFDKIKEDLKDKTIKRDLLTLFIISTLYILPILLVGIKYHDDYGKTLLGWGWGPDARYINIILLKTLSLGGAILDFYPFNQWIASFLLSLSGYILVKKTLNPSKRYIRISLSLFPLVFPFTLQNLAFQYDAFFMSLSVIAVVIPFLFLDNLKFYFWFSFLGTFLNIFTYQSSFIVYPILAIFLLIPFLLKNKIKESFIFLLFSILAPLLSLILQKISFLIPILDQQADYYHRMTTSILTTESPFSLFLSNMRKSFLEIVNLLNQSSSLFLFSYLILSIFLLSFFYLTKKVFFSEKIETLNKIGILLILSFLLFIPLFSYSILEKFTPYQGRLYFPITFAFFGYLLFIGFFNQKVASFLATLLIIFSFPLMNAFSKSLKEQFIFDQFLISKIFTGVNTEEKDIIVIGNTIPSPATQTLSRGFPLLKELTTESSLFRNKVYSFYLFPIAPYQKNYSQSGVRVFDKREKNDIDYENIPIIKEDIYFTLRENPNIIVLELKNDN